MDNRNKVMEIVRAIKPNKDMTQITDIIDGSYLDSFELMALITQLSENFEIEIEIDDITPENFNSIDAITKLVERLLSK